MLLYKVNVYHIGFSLSFIWVAFLAALSLDNFFILGLCGGPLSTVRLIWALVCDKAASVACVDPLIILSILSSSDVRSHRSTSSSGVLLSDNCSLCTLVFGTFFSVMGANTKRLKCILEIGV